MSDINPLSDDNSFYHHLKSFTQGEFGGKYAGFQQYTVVTAAATAKVDLSASF